MENIQNVIQKRITITILHFGNKFGNLEQVEGQEEFIFVTKKRRIPILHFWYKFSTINNIGI